MLIYEVERIFRQGFSPRAVNIKLTPSVVFSLQKNFMTKLYSVLEVQDVPLLRFSLTKGNMKRTPIAFSLATQIGKHSLNNQSQTEKPQTKSKSRDGINPDSKFTSPDPAGADS